MAGSVFSNDKIFSLLLVSRSVRDIGYFDLYKGVHNSSLIYLTKIDEDRKGDR